MTRAPIPDTVTLHVPFRVVKRGGRKEMQMPEGGAQPRRTDNTLVKALARAFRWKRMLESGDLATIAELAEREGIAPSYMTRVLRLTLIAPDLVEAILDAKQGPVLGRAAGTLRCYRLKRSFVLGAANGSFKPGTDLGFRRSIRRSGRDPDDRCSVDERPLCGSKA